MSMNGDHFRDCFTGVDDASDIGDVSLLLEEAQHFITRAISRFRVDLSQCEAELRKVSGERDALRLLCSQKDKAIKDLQANLAKVREEEDELDKQLLPWRIMASQWLIMEVQSLIMAIQCLLSLCHFIKQFLSNLKRHKSINSTIFNLFIAQILCIPLTQSNILWLFHYFPKYCFRHSL
ncbi:uncharacterized protein [Nicotiana tomentosiformis]|uniref:uncharacterized protein isoform X1 n=1 Tax=Nicotiana tomentosiformis TaxID=4098 RepID=UPI00388C4D5A